MSQHHTPGPWNVRDHTTPYGGRHIWVEGGDSIGATMAGPYKRQILEDEDYDEKLADANLIAATPELLDLAHNVGGFDDGLLLSADLNLIRSTLREWRDQARAALDKATGAQS